MNITEGNYLLTLDSNYFDENILLDKSERILPIRLRKTNDLYGIEASKIKILDINKNNYCGYILYEIVNTNNIY